MLISSPPFGPCSVAHDVAGLGIDGERRARCGGRSCRCPACSRRVASERIVRRHAAIVAQPQHLAGVVVGILRAADLRSGAGRADGHVEHAVAAEGDPRRLGVGGVRLEDVLHVGQRLPSHSVRGAQRSPAARRGVPIGLWYVK